MEKLHVRRGTNNDASRPIQHMEWDASTFNLHMPFTVIATSGPLDEPKSNAGGNTDMHMPLPIFGQVVRKDS